MAGKGLSVSDRLGYYTGPVVNFLTKPDNDLAKNSKKVGFVDKLAKVVGVGIEAVVEGERRWGASDSTIKETQKAREITSNVRDGIGLLNVFGGVIPKFVVGVGTSYELSKALCKGEEVDDVSGKQKPSVVQIKLTTKYNDKAVGWKEQSLALGRQAGELISGGACIAAFGLSRPIANFEKWRGKPFGETAHKIGTSFSIIMMIGHCGTIIACIFTMAFEAAACDRECDEKGYAHMDYKEYEVKIKATGLELLEKTLDLGLDVIKVGNFAVPPEARITIAALVALLGLYRAWEATA